MSGGAVDAACRAVRERLFEHVGGRARDRPAAARHRRHRRGRLDRRPAGAGRGRRRRACTSTRRSSTTTARPRSSTPTGRATATRRSPSSPTGRWSTSTPSSAWSRSCRWRRPRTSGGRSTRCRCSARSRAASPRASAWRVMEEIVQIDGRIRNASFTDYLLPTFLDMPDVVATLVEEPDPQAPLGAKGVGEPPCISVDAGHRRGDPRRAAPGRRRAAPGRASARVPDDRPGDDRSSGARPVRPSDIALGRGDRGSRGPIR